MKFKFLFISLISISFLACGAKKTEGTTKANNDSVSPKKDSVPINSTVVDTSNNVVVDMTEDDIKIDANASPENVVKTIIKAGRTHNYGGLSKLCNEAIDMDGDAKDICGIASSKKQHQDEFDDYFGNAKIVGKARIKNGIAEVDIETTAEGGSKETIVCQVKYDKWYLKGL